MNTLVFYFFTTITIVKTLQKRMIAARTARGLSQAELAAAVGCSQSTIGNIESGYRKTMRDITAAARALNVSAEWLSEGIGPGPNDAYTTAEQGTPPTVLHINEHGHGLPTIPPHDDPWAAEILRIMATLDVAQKQAVVARVREFVGYLGPPYVGQALQVAG